MSNVINGRIIADSIICLMHPGIDLPRLKNIVEKSGILKKIKSLRYKAEEIESVFWMEVDEARRNRMGLKLSISAAMEAMYIIDGVGEFLFPNLIKMVFNTHEVQTVPATCVINRARLLKDSQKPWSYDDKINTARWDLLMEAADIARNETKDQKWPFEPPDWRFNQEKKEVEWWGIKCEWGQGVRFHIPLGKALVSTGNLNGRSEYLFGDYRPTTGRDTWKNGPKLVRL